MTLKKFLDMWTRKNLSVIICPWRYYDDMFDAIDEINDCGASVFSILEYVTCAVIPHLSQFTEAYYLKPEIVNSTVENFFICKDAMIVWIGEEEINNANGLCV